MKAAFLDTSGWFAALSPKEAAHKAALAAYREWVEGGTQLVTTNLVVAEMQILLMRFRGPAEGLRFLMPSTRMRRTRWSSSVEISSVARSTGGSGASRISH